ncbi:MAG TPA: tyrosine-type recombinase/integrase [Verrucomicrobiae bacterium]|jgi:integrase
MIFSVEKRRFRKGGELRETRNYYLRYRIGEMPADKWVSLGIAADKESAEKKAREFIRNREREAAGIADPQPLLEAAKTTMAGHLDDYLADLASRGRDGRAGRGARLLGSRIRTLLKECKWHLPYNVTAGSFVTWRNQQKFGPRTKNHYLQGMFAFLNWMERVDRLKSNPLKNVQKADEQGKQKRIRRAFTDDELRKLINGSGPRGIIYFTAARTGLRQEELRQLTWGDVLLDKKIPLIVVRAETAKNKTEEPVFLVPEIAEALAAYRPPRWSVRDLVFPNGIPRASRLKVDAEWVGVAYRDEKGRYADFHALRYT